MAGYLDKGVVRGLRYTGTAGVRVAFTGSGIHVRNQGQMISQNGVSARARRCYQELIRFVDLHGYVPSYAELSEALGCSTSTVSRYLDQLQEAGLIERRSRQARSIVIRLEG
jgi:Fic family protein